MKQMYIILSAAGWIWTVIITIVLVRKLRSASPPPGFDVTPRTDSTGEVE